MIQATSFINSQLDHLFGTRRQANLPKHDAVTAANNKFDGATNLVEFNAEIANTFAATPSPSRTRPSKRCSVPI